MAERTFDLTIDPGVAYRIVELARELDSEDMAPDPDGMEVDTDPGDDPISNEEAFDEEIAAERVDPIESELRAVIEGLNIDAQRDLLALIWVGRGDHEASDFYQARRQAREIPNLHVADYLEETPLAAEYLVEALEQIGYPQSDYERG